MSALVPVFRNHLLKHEDHWSWGELLWNSRDLLSAKDFLEAGHLAPVFTCKIRDLTPSSIHDEPIWLDEQSETKTKIYYQPVLLSKEIRGQLQALGCLLIISSQWRWSLMFQSSFAIFLFHGKAISSWRVLWNLAGFLC